MRREYALRGRERSDEEADTDGAVSVGQGVGIVQIEAVGEELELQRQHLPETDAHAGAEVAGEGVLPWLADIHRRLGRIGDDVIAARRDRVAGADVDERRNPI